MINCPNCGAPITGDKCEYCGSNFGHLNSEIRRLQNETQAIRLQMEQEHMLAVAIGVLTPNDIRKEIGFKSI